MRQNLTEFKSQVAMFTVASGTIGLSATVTSQTHLEIRPPGRITFGILGYLGLVSLSQNLFQGYP
jgi:hypothetical protein